MTIKKSGVKCRTFLALKKCLLLKRAIYILHLRIKCCLNSINTLIVFQNLINCKVSLNFLNCALYTQYKGTLSISARTGSDCTHSTRARYPYWLEQVLTVQTSCCCSTVLSTHHHCEWILFCRLSQVKHLYWKLLLYFHLCNIYDGFLVWFYCSPLCFMLQYFKVCFISCVSTNDKMPRLQSC